MDFLQPPQKKHVWELFWGAGVKSAKKGHFFSEIFFDSRFFSPKDHYMLYKLAVPSEVPEISAKKIFKA